MTRQHPDQIAQVRSFPFVAPGAVTEPSLNAILAESPQLRPISRAGGWKARVYFIGTVTLRRLWAMPAPESGRRSAGGFTGHFARICERGRALGGCGDDSQHYLVDAVWIDRGCGRSVHHARAAAGR